MSLVNWSRWKLHCTERAKACASVVLPTPGTSSIKRCPRARAHTSDSRTTSGLPRIAEARESSKSVTFDSATGAATITAIVTRGFESTMSESDIMPAASNRATRLVWILTVLLVAIGLIAAARRTYVILFPPRVPRFAAAAALDTGFAAHPVLTLVHIL